MGNFSFKEFINSDQYQYSDLEIANMYFGLRNMKVSEISDKTGKSVKELYDIVNRHGKPNRREKTNKQTISWLYQSGMPINQIAEITHTSQGHIRNILKKVKYD